MVNNISRFKGFKIVVPLYKDIVRKAFIVRMRRGKRVSTVKNFSEGPLGLSVMSLQVYMIMDKLG